MANNQKTPGKLHLEEIEGEAMVVQMEGRRAMLALMIMRAMEGYPAIANIILTGAACYCKKQNLSLDELQKVIDMTDFSDIKF